MDGNDPLRTAAFVRELAELLGVRTPYAAVVEGIVAALLSRGQLRPLCPTCVVGTVLERCPEMFSDPNVFDRSHTRSSAHN